MRLAELLSGIEHYSLFDKAKHDTDIKRVIMHSRNARKGDLFIAVKGSFFDGHDFLNEVIEKGVDAVIVEEPVLGRDNLAQIKVRDSRRVLSLLARNFYRDPSKDVRLIGITGTNGKTTVSYILENIFKVAGIKTGRIGTINYKIGNELVDATHTTPDALRLNELLGKMVKGSATYCVMEASSQGLDQGRLDDILFRAAIFTNLSHEHLDYHKSFSAYLEAKLKLFEKLDHDSYAVINRDSVCFDEVVSRLDAELITYGIDGNPDVAAKNLKADMEGSRFTIVAPKARIAIKTSLIGKHNVYNILAAASVAIREGIDISSIKAGIEGLGTIPGRMEAIDCGQNFKVFVDYAHTEDALRNALIALRALHNKNKLILVFGCGGDRDRSKRSRMGMVAAKLADFTVVTSDNPRSEDPASIAREIEKGFKGTPSKYTVILDRYKAIETALRASEEGVTVLLAGKGHEKRQVYRYDSVPFDDREVARKILEDLK